MLTRNSVLDVGDDEFSSMLVGHTPSFSFLDDGFQPL